MNFSFYTVDTRYCDFLRKTDPLVPYTKDEKAGRPFVGIVFSVNGFHYYAPLTSPKPKHLQMKNQIDKSESHPTIPNQISITKTFCPTSFPGAIPTENSY